ncbi:hypothetical protein ABZ756_02185 [Mammaliicoccus sciuri]
MNDQYDYGLKEVLNGVAGQFISFILIIVVAYCGTYLLLSVVKVPYAFKKLAAVIVTCIAIYYGYMNVFLA